MREREKREPALELLCQGRRPKYQKVPRRENISEGKKKGMRAGMTRRNDGAGAFLFLL